MNGEPSTPALEVRGRVATISLRRPAHANRIEPADIATMVAQIAECNANDDVLVVRIVASGTYFSSGFDIGQLGDGKPSEFEDLPNALEDARAITIAAINGPVFGGATDVALACDFRLGVAATRAAVPAARIGIHFYGRGLQRYVSRLGVNAAKALLLAGETLDAEQLRACGFLERVYPDDAALRAGVEALTATIAGFAPLAITGMKKHLNDIAAGRIDPAGLAADIAAAQRSDDLREGAAARREKRVPRFRGR